jgi:hypothetical protein
MIGIKNDEIRVVARTPDPTWHDLIDVPRLACATKLACSANNARAQIPNSDFDQFSWLYAVDDGGNNPSKVKVRAGIIFSLQSVSLARVRSFRATLRPARKRSSK